jgi:hypothetical protein
MFDTKPVVSEATPGALTHTKAHAMPGELLDGIGDLTQADLSALSMANLATLCDRIAHIKRSITHYEGILHRAMDQRFALRAQALRIAAGKTTGTVRLTEGDHVVIATLAKRPSYDQAKLKDAVAQLLAQGEDPTHFVDVAYQIPEHRYQAWPPAIKKLFEPARTVKAAKPTYEIEPIGATQSLASNEHHFQNLDIEE